MANRFDIMYQLYSTEEFEALYGEYSWKFTVKKCIMID